MIRKDRLSHKEKNSNKQQWYKERIDEISANRLSENIKLKIKVNYDLFNNKVDIKEFDYIIKPLGDKIGSLPVEFNNRDIVSGKIKALLGMEMQRPFNYRVYSTNPEATTAKEKKEFDMIKQWVVDSIMQPIREQLEQQSQQQIMQMQQDPQMQTPEGQQMMQEQIQQMQQQMQEQEKQMTPKEIRKYMQREYQDPAEVLSSQLLAYLSQKCKLKNKFSKLFLNGLLSARSIAYVGAFNDEPEIWIVNPMNFNFSKTSDTDFIEDAEWAVCEYNMTPSQITSYFNKELTDKDLDMIYQETSLSAEEDLFKDLDMQEDKSGLVTVYHCVWKSLRKIGFLTYTDEAGEEQTTLVDEHYKIEGDVGDIKIEWEWIPEVYEGWKINTSDPIYVNMRPLPGQFKDLDDLYHCKLPYYGCIYDYYNSEETSLMDRLKSYQYFYNIIMYRLELLLASDKGKKLLMSIKNIPESAGMDVDAWQYFMESSPIVWYNPDEEGKGTSYDANTVAKVMDLSLVSDVQKYQQLAEYIKQQCGKSVGITEQVEGQIGQYEAVRNTNQAIIQSSYILEPYFQLHEASKVNILTALLEQAKVCYGKGDKKKLSYMLDDFSRQIINVDPALLNNSTLGIFVGQSTKTEQIKETITQLAQAALQNQTVEFSDIISIMNVESVPEATEILEAAQIKREEQVQQMQQQQYQQQMEMQKAQQEAMAQQHEREKELILLKETERRKTEVAKMSLMGASFNPDTDNDKDGQNDFIELSKLELQKLQMAEDFAIRREQMQQDKDLALAKNNTDLAKEKMKNNASAIKRKMTPNRV